MTAMCSAIRCRIGALVCGCVFVVSNVFFFVGFSSHDRPSTLSILLLDAILLISGTLLYRRSRRLRPASPLSKHYQVD